MTGVVTAPFYEESRSSRLRRWLALSFLVLALGLVSPQPASFSSLPAIKPERFHRCCL